MNTATLWRKFKSFLLWRKTDRFGVLRFSDLRPVHTTMPIMIERHADDSRCSKSVLASIKGKIANWERRWARGHVCYLAIVGCEPASYVWIAFDGWRLADEDDPHALPESAAFVYDGITLPAWRGKNLFPALMHAAATDLAGSGYSELYVLVDDSNIAPQHAFRKVGFEFTDKTVKTYRVLKFARFRRCSKLV
jgi:GNAT superfamily N-acetyltransferase